VYGGFLEPGKPEGRAVRPARSRQLSRASGADVGVGVASSNRGRFKRPLRSVSDPERSEQSRQTGRGKAVCAAVCAGRALKPTCRPQPRRELQVSAIMVGTRLRARTRAPTVGAPVMSDASTQMDLVTKETSVQAAASSECPEPSSGALLSACTRCWQVEDLISQVAELQETVNRLRSIRGAELETDT